MKLQIPIGKGAKNPNFEIQNLSFEEFAGAFQKENLIEGVEKNNQPWFMCTPDWTEKIRQKQYISPDAQYHMIIIDADSPLEDGGKMPSVLEVYKALQKHDIKGFVYNSYTTDKDKFRIVVHCKPVHHSQLESATRGLYEQLNLPLKWAYENSTLARIWYFGGSNKPDSYQFEYHDGEIWEPTYINDPAVQSIAPNLTSSNEPARSGQGELSPANQILAGSDLHNSINKLGMKLAREGYSESAAQAMIEGLMNQSSRRGEDSWRERFDDIQRSVSSGFEKIKKPLPLPRYEIQASNFPTTLLPTNIVKAAEALHKFTFMPMSYCVRGMFPVIASGHGNSVWVQEDHGLIIPVNSIEVMTGRTGSYKSSFFDNLVKPLVERERDLKKNFRDGVHAAESMKKATNNKIKALENNLGEEISKGHNDKAIEKIALEIARLKNMTSKDMHEPVLYIQESTDQGMAEECHRQGGSIMIATDEGDEVFSNLLGRFEANQANISDSFLIKASQGGTYSRTRSKGNAGGSFKIDSAVANGIILVQPEKLAPFYTDERVRSKGLLARFNITNEPDMIGQRFIDVERGNGLNVASMTGYYDVVNDLLDRRLQGKASPLGWLSGDKERMVMELDSSAQKLRNEIYNQNEKLLADKTINEERNKATSRIVKEAVILQAMDGNYSKTLKPQYLESAYELDKYSQEMNARTTKAYQSHSAIEKARDFLRLIISTDQKLSYYQQNGINLGALKKTLKDNSKLRGHEDEFMLVLTEYQWVTYTSTKNGRGVKFLINFNRRDVVIELNSDLRN
ncbi:DUF3987 domain-containing protein [Thiomicrorhabdus sp. 6S3-12]|uniref:DUF3987 domain-containing protein n=1 Tax=Thiomicrorhabdus sp. 6S3-12 TaxID=2819681 RepID=UPI001AACD787|nr:DUF3987 domain-containing protein [Thiomicrorhabdus sp. 6S3-12]MBO1924573.1 DUF3987 domain-containing protein [Thiomicrorhabdus sp. 6S3-12]